MVILDKKCLLVFKNEVQVGDSDYFSPIWCEIMLISGGFISIWRCFCCFVPDLKACLTGGVSIGLLSRPCAWKSILFHDFSGVT